jgi:hypothetical protein
LGHNCPDPISRGGTRSCATHKVSAAWATSLTTAQTEVHHEEFILAAAVLSPGAGSAFVTRSHSQAIWGPAYGNDAAGG